MSVSIHGSGLQGTVLSYGHKLRTHHTVTAMVFWNLAPLVLPCGLCSGAATRDICARSAGGGVPARWPYALMVSTQAAVSLLTSRAPHGTGPALESSSSHWTSSFSSSKPRPTPGQLHGMGTGSSSPSLGMPVFPDSLDLGCPHSLKLRVHIFCQMASPGLLTMTFKQTRGRANSLPSIHFLANDHERPRGHL